MGEPLDSDKDSEPGMTLLGRGRRQREQFKQSKDIPESKGTMAMTYDERFCLSY
jgi:hypothetical protein